MKKSIKKQIIERILSNPNKASSYFCELTCIVEEREVYERDYTVKKLKEQIYPYLFYFMGENFEFESIDDLKKILEDIEKILVKRINIISQNKNNKNFYELMSLVTSLTYLGRNAFENDKLIKNDRVKLCYDLEMLILDNCSRKEVLEWFNERFKTLKFN